MRRAFSDPDHREGLGRDSATIGESLSRRAGGTAASIRGDRRALHALISQLKPERVLETARMSGPRRFIMALALRSVSAGAASHHGRHPRRQRSLTASGARAALRMSPRDHASADRLPRHDQVRGRAVGRFHAAAAECERSSISSSSTAIMTAATVYREISAALALLARRAERSFCTIIIRKGARFSPDRGADQRPLSGARGESARRYPGHRRSSARRSCPGRPSRASNVTSLGRCVTEARWRLPPVQLARKVPNIGPKT